MKVLELPQRPVVLEEEPPLPPPGKIGPVQGGLRRIADEALDRVDPVGFGRALAFEAAGLLRHPLSTAGAIARWANGAVVATGVSAVRAVGATPPGPMPMPAKDRRFTDKTWEENALFFWLLQHHLLREQLAKELLEVAELDETVERKARLASQLLVDALAPTNFFLTNPTALRRAFESGGLSALRGMRKWLDDVRTREGWPRLVDRSGFEVGKNIACTPGKVVYRNRLFELIQYAPQTKTVHSVPLLCCPPFINKYYIMDLAPGRSFIEWAVKNGHTTFCMSYRNPDLSLRDVGFGDYLLEGPVEAFRVVKEITGAPKVNVAALCVGGTLATMLAAYLEATGDRSLNSLTLMNTLVDFSEPGPLGAYTDRPTMERLLRRVDRVGLLESHEMARTFNLLRPERPVLQLLRLGMDDGRGAAGVRPARLERRRNAHPGAPPLRVPARLLSGQRPRPGRDDHPGQAAAAGVGEAGHVHRRRGGGPHHALALRLPDHQPPRGQRCSSSSAARATSPGL